jgi:hypothetical protein
MTRKDLVMLLDELKDCCDDLYISAPDPNTEDEERYENDAASFCDSTVWSYFYELAVRCMTRSTSWKRAANYRAHSNALSEPKNRLLREHPAPQRIRPVIRTEHPARRGCCFWSRQA